MSYDFTVGKHYRVKANKVYPWPCEALPHRTMEIFTDDILTVNEKGVIFKQTGLGTFGHVIPFDDLIEQPGPVNLRML